MPAVTHAVWKNNKALPAGALKINLVGLAIGNGLTDPQEQYKHYPEMAASTNDHKAAIGKLGIAAMKLAAPVCTSAIAKCNANNTNACSTAMALCNLGLVSPYQVGHMQRPVTASHGPVTDVTGSSAPATWATPRIRWQSTAAQAWSLEPGAPVGEVVERQETA